MLKGQHTWTGFHKKILFNHHGLILGTQKTFPFRIDGHHGVRSFEITASYGGCELDSGWLVITGPDCGWERRQGVVPGILYSKKTHNITWNDNQGRNCL